MYDSLTQKQLFEFGSNLKILYVEDNNETREMIIELFKGIFKNIIVAVDGQDGLSKFDDSIDLIITDINMPKLNGVEMLKKIREKNKIVDTMIISAHNDTSYFTQTIELGVDGYLLKPINPNSFYPSLLKVLEKIFFKKELENYKKLLEQKVNDQIKELEEKNNALVQQSKLAIMGEIIDIVAHQWKHPINLISMKAKFLQEFYFGEDHISMKEVQECNEFVTLQVNHLIDTIDEFRGFLRPNTNMNVCDLMDIFNSVKILLKDDFMNHQIKLNVKCAEMMKINTNENEIKHIFISLISNSKDAFNINDIKGKYIDIEVFDDNGDIKIIYKDNAGGIPSSVIDKLFEPNVTTKKDSGGTGIGLYMVKMIIKKYAGEIEVSNQADGASFIFTFRKSNEDAKTA